MFCKYVLICKYISLSTHCKYHHSIIVHIIIISSLLIYKYHHMLIHLLCSFVKFVTFVSFRLIFVHSKLWQFITSLSYLCVFLRLRVFNHTLPVWCAGDSYLYYIFLPLFVGCCISILLSGVELPCTSLLHWDSFELLNGRGVATESNVLWSTPFPAHESTCGCYIKRVPLDA